jgi:S1-C subfamily serine protease
LKITEGVVVTGVLPGSPALEAGIRIRDVIHRIDQTPVTNKADFMQKANSLKSGDEVAIQIERGGRMAFVTVTID